MKFLICPASDEQLAMGGETDLFVGADQTAYTYEVYFDGETVSITDTVGRMVPFDVTELGGLIKMLHRIDTFHKNTESANAYLYSKLIEGASY